jgi:hypothetical protein
MEVRRGPWVGARCVGRDAWVRDAWGAMRGARCVARDAWRASPRLSRSGVVGWPSVAYGEGVCASAVVVRPRDKEGRQGGLGARARRR